MTTKLHGLWPGLVLAVMALPLGPVGCKRDARLAGKTLRDVKVRPVAHYGVTLDENASPEQTAYVLLRAVREDFLAANNAEREAALDIQYDVAAIDVLTGANRTSLDRNEVIYHIIHQWTPGVSHYVNDFETEWEKAKGRFVRADIKEANDSRLGTRECRVMMQVADPDGDPNASVVLVVGLVEDNGLWRALGLGFTPRTRTLRNRTASAGG